MRALLIHNPKAGDRKHGKKQLMWSLKKNGLQAFYQSIKERGWEKAFKKPVDLVIAAGGDGTVHKTAWQLMGSGIPLAILPLGTANNLARSLGFTESVDEILQSLHCGKGQPFDVGVARRSSRSEYFLEAAGGGLFADYFPAAMANEQKGSFAGGRTDRALIAAAGVVVGLSGAQVANQHRRRGYFRSLHFMGCNEHSLGWPGATPRSKSKNRRWRAGLCRGARGRTRDFHQARRCASGRTKSTGSVDVAQISRARYYVATGRAAS